MTVRKVIAGINRASKAIERDARRRQREAVREHAAAQRRAEQAYKAEQKLLKEAERADAAEAKRLLAEAKAAHIASKEAEVEELNAEIAEIYDAIDSILAATLDVDDYVDLQALRQTAEHPAFDQPELAEPIKQPSLVLPEKPNLTIPDAPTGLFARKKKHQKTVAKLEADHELATEDWNEQCERAKSSYARAIEEHALLEKEQEAKLTVALEVYEAACKARDEEINEQNKEIDQLIANLGYGTPEAIEEYIAIVMSNSIYPDIFPVEQSFQFDTKGAELTMEVSVPKPTAIPDIKTHRYVKKSDEITCTALSRKAAKDRYADAMKHVALRTLHEVFEADRRGLIQSMSVVVGTNDVDPATGKQGFIPLLAVAARRDQFIEFDLSAVVPDATLKLLGASVSKDPLGLVPAAITGIRQQ